MRPDPVDSAEVTEAGKEAAVASNRRAALLHAAAIGATPQDRHRLLLGPAGRFGPLRTARK